MSITSKYHKNENNEFVCPTCGVIKKNQNTMYYHMQTHEGHLQYECNICKKEFMQKSSLEIHKLSKHREKEVKDTIVCPVISCKFESLTKGNLITHFMRKHCKDEISELMNDDYSCNECCEQFNSSSAFYYHVSNCIKFEDVKKEKQFNSII